MQRRALHPHVRTRSDCGALICLGLRPGGVKVMTVFCGPTDDDWYQDVPPPKLLPGAIARSVVQGLRDGVEDVWCGDVAKDYAERWRQDPRVLERELAGDVG